MASQLIYAGTRITASLLNSIAPLAAVKVADQSVTSSTTLVNDNTLFVSVLANAVYLAQCQVIYDGANALDIKYGWNVPTGATLVWNDNPRLTIVSALSTPFADLTTGSTSYGPGQGATANQASYFRGLLTTGNSAGTLQLQWAQNASGATATRVRAGSYLVAWRLQ